MHWARCNNDAKHPWKAGIVELSGVIVSILLFLGPLSVAALGEYLRGLSGSFARRRERSLDDAYCLNFQALSAEARTLDAKVGYALQRAKRALDQVRKGSSNELHVWVALGQVSEWLGSAAEISDRALRSLEDDRLQTKRSQVGIFTKNDLGG
jgi:hypothetical protein